MSHECVVCSVQTDRCCSRCKEVYYCSQECQHKDWSRHRYQDCCARVIWGVVDNRNLRGNYGNCKICFSSPLQSSCKTWYSKNVTADLVMWTIVDFRICVKDRKTQANDLIGKTLWYRASDCGYTSGCSLYFSEKECARNQWISPWMKEQGIEHEYLSVRVSE